MTVAANISLIDWTVLPTTLPSGWRVLRLKFVASVRLSNVDKKSVEGEEPVRLCNYVDVYKNDFIRADMDFMEATATPAQVKRFSLKRGDVIVTKDSEEWSDIAVPAYVTEDMPGVLCGYHLALLRPRPGLIDGRFLFRALAAEGVADQFRVAANGITRFGLGMDDIAGALLPVPPLHVQVAIADYLDQKSAQIGDVISGFDITPTGGRLAKFVNLLHEYKEALVSSAVLGKRRVPQED